MMSSPLIEATSFQPMIQTENLHFYYGTFHALKNINLDIKQQKITSLIGPSGCGKSTFLRTLNRMNDLVKGTRVEGKIKIKNRDIHSAQMDLVELRKRVGMVFQQANPFPMSIYDNIAYGPRIHGINEKQKLDMIVESCLRSAALWDEVKDQLNKVATDLSGGQQQRLVLARVLAVQPEIILMDEPTSALDPVSTMKLEQLISELKKKYTIVIVTHNMQQAARISDETAFFLHGEVVEFAETNQLFTNPKNKQTEDYISGRFG